MIEHKLDDDTVIVGRAIKISELAIRKANLEIMQTDSQDIRDSYDSQTVEMQEKLPLPIDFTDEIVRVQERIDKYTKATVGEIKPEDVAVKLWEIDK